MNESATGIEQLMVHAAWLRRFAGALLRDADDADDVVQSALVAAWQTSAPDPSQPRSWLARIAQNRAKDVRRTEQRRQAREAIADEIHPGEAVTPEQLMGDLEIHRTVAEVVTALPQPYRETVLLRYYEGLSAADIAGRLGVPAGTVRWRLKEGLDRVRRELDGRCGGRQAGRWRCRRCWRGSRRRRLAARRRRSAGRGRPSTAASGALARRSLGSGWAALLVAVGGGVLVTASLWWRGDAPDGASGPAPAGPASTVAATGAPGAARARTWTPPRFATRPASPGQPVGIEAAAEEADQDQHEGPEGDRVLAPVKRAAIAPLTLPSPRWERANGEVAGLTDAGP